MNDPVALAQALTKGPIAVGVDASDEHFRYYFGGIMDFPCKTDVNHGVLLVGLDSFQGQDYWLLKNSWGSVWGEDGYFRMPRDMKAKDAGFCGLYV